LYEVQKMKPLSIILTILLFLCLADMPYGYYQFVRFAAAAFFAYGAYTENESGSKKLAIVFIILAILFQPFFKIALGRTLWNIVDVIVGLGLLGYSQMKVSSKNLK
jgi:predicted membrane protein